jgi:hypothetical protein
VSQLGSGDDAVLVGDHLEQCRIEHTPTVGSGIVEREESPQIRSRDCAQRNVGSEFSIGE